MRLQFTQGSGDMVRALRKLPGEGLDVDAGTGGQRLDVHGQPDGEQRQFAALGEMVADHREASGVTSVVVDDAGDSRIGPPGRVARVSLRGGREGWGLVRVLSPRCSLGKGAGRTGTQGARIRGWTTFRYEASVVAYGRTTLTDSQGGLEETT